jgi:hypothetical protein
VGAHLLSNSKGEGRQADGGDVVSGGSEIAARLEIAAPGASATLAVERDAADFLNAWHRPEVRRRGLIKTASCTAGGSGGRGTKRSG